jgi:hypothetical protein
MNDINYKGSVISLVTQQFGNGTAVEVSVDGVRVVDRFEARALFATEAEAKRRGEQYGRDVIDGLPSDSGKHAGAPQPATMPSWNPGDHGTGTN